MKLDMRIWDVNHGNSMSVKLPNGNVMMIDCGSNPNTNFSSINQTRRLWGKDLSYLIISHPYMDHIRDIVNIDSFKPTTLLRPKLHPSILRNGKSGSNLDVIDTYIDFQNNYTAPARSPSAPSKEWGNQVEVTNYSLNGDHNDLNDYSFVTFISYGGFHFLSGGDLSSSGWDRLVEQEGQSFLDRLSKVNFFQASHHGRREGFTPDILDTMNPSLVLISDKEVQDTSVTERYRPFCQGWKITDENTGDETTRKVLTTRNDGRIKINVEIDDTTRVGVSTR